MDSHPSPASSSLPLSPIFFIAVCLCFSLVSSCATEFKPAPGVSIPKNLEEAYVELDRMFTLEEKQSLKNGETEVEELILTFGMQLKEYWGLWQDSKIAKYLRKRDVKHPDQMIAVIFNGYLEYLKRDS